MSNKWTFYPPAELRALEWADIHHRRASIWTGFDERLRSVFWVRHGASTAENYWDAFQPKPDTRAFLVSDVIRFQGVRQQQPLPIGEMQNRTYDNGLAQVYRFRATTPYQR